MAFTIQSLESDVSPELPSQVWTAIMAEDLIEFMKNLESTEPPPFTAPEVYYGEKEDSLFFYFKNDESYAHRLDRHATIFLSFDTHDLVGCQIKGLKSKLQSDGFFAVAIADSKKLKVGLFFHLLAYDLPEPDSRNKLVELGQHAKDLELSLC